MKTLFCFIVAFLLAADVSADPRRYPSRLVGAANVELQPLFAWWTLASQTTNQPLNITGLGTNNLAALSNLWLRLPRRPLLDWFDIKASEDKILVVGSLWKIDATIEPAPMMFRRQTIFLRNPPVKEIQNFKLARAAFIAIQGAQSQDMAAELLSESDIQTEADRLLQTNLASSTVPGKLADVAQTRKLQQDMVMTAANLTNAHDRTQARDPELKTAQTYLATFPDTQVYWLDHFTLRTGEAIDGIEVYDLGTAPGLTY